MVREGLTEKMVFEQREQAMHIFGRTFAERRKNRYEDLEARVCLICLRRGKELLTRVKSEQKGGREQGAAVPSPEASCWPL